MLSLEQCIGLCGLDEDDVAWIAAHEKVPDIVAAQLACHWMNSPQGGERLQCVLLDTLRQARACGDTCTAARLEARLAAYPAAAPASGDAATS